MRAGRSDAHSTTRRDGGRESGRYFGKEIPKGGRLSWKRPAREVVNFVRACDYWPYRSPWGHPKVSFEGREIAVAKAIRTFNLTAHPERSAPQTTQEFWSRPLTNGSPSTR